VQSPKKPDLTNEIIKKLSENSSELAQSVYEKTAPCDPHVRDCSQRTQVKYKNQSKFACMSKAYFKMLPSEFETVKSYITAASEVV
jgi:hypothetical protein